jgi:hypothetical protein
LSSPVVTLLALVIGLGAAVALVAAITRGRFGGARAWLVAVAVVAVAGLAATWPVDLRDAATGIDEQRKAHAGTAEWEARARCLSDMSRPDLVEALDFARQVMPEDARYRLPTSTSPACLVTNLLPREPVHPANVDPARDWIIHDVAVPPEVRQAAVRDAQLPETQRRFLLHPPNFVLVRPEEALPR